MGSSATTMTRRGSAMGGRPKEPLAPGPDGKPQAETSRRAALRGCDHRRAPRRASESPQKRRTHHFNRASGDRVAAAREGQRRQSGSAPGFSAPGRNRAAARGKRGFCSNPAAPLPIRTRIVSRARSTTRRGSPIRQLVRRARIARPGAMTMTDYEVGYGRPPKATRFKKGVCANPRGRGLPTAPGTPRS